MRSLLLFALLASTPLGAQIQFTDVSVAAGVSGDTYSSPTTHSLGINWIDYDADGWPDLFLVGGGPQFPPHLFHNEGDGTFARADALLPPLPPVEMSGSVFADYDRDGDLDLFIYTDNDDWRLASSNNLQDGPPNLLLKNLWVENGGAAPGTGPLFEEVASAAGVAGLAQPPLGDLLGYRAKTASWFDADRDGCIDLYVGHLVINAAGEEANRDRFYRNRCDGTFEDATTASNLVTDPTTWRAALASGGFHLNGDLWPDLYVVNVSYRDPQPYLNDLIYLNDGLREEGAVTFTEVAATMPGVGDDTQAGMGIDVADVDLDGDWDVYISDIWDTVLDEKPLGNAFYLSDGLGGYGDNSAAAAGIEGASSWGVNFFDADRDGFEDLYVSTIQNATIPEILYRNNGPDALGQVSFTNVAANAGFSTGSSRGSAIADYDRDGDLDLAVVNQNGPLQLFRNDTITSGRWLALELEGLASSRDAIGTVIEATANGVRRLRQVKGGSSAHSQDSLTVHFGLGDATVVEELKVRWASGFETVLQEVPTNQSLRVVEPLLFRDGFESGDLSAWVVP